MARMLDPVMLTAVAQVRIEVPMAQGSVTNGTTNGIAPSEGPRLSRVVERDGMKPAYYSVVGPILVFL